MSLVLLPIMGLTALVVKLTSPGPPSTARNASAPTAARSPIYKFRIDAPGRRGRDRRSLVAEERPAHHAVCRIMRRTRLDELPQLERRARRRACRPAARAAEARGRADRADPVLRPAPCREARLTGWAQVRYTYGASVEDALEKLQYDLFYIKHMSAAMDFYILFETIKTVVLRRGA
jgi:lipopolysaccharide/colanic/teichoic acid biosynthesis glycosyltransferase